MNLALLARVADAIERTGRFDITFWAINNSTVEGTTYYNAGDLLNDDIVHNCDTTACYAGWTVAIAIEEGIPFDKDLPMRDAATDLLDIGDDQARLLFFPSSPFWTNYLHDHGPEVPEGTTNHTLITPEVAVTVLRHIIKGDLTL